LSFFAGAKVPSSIPPESLDEIAFVGKFVTMDIKQKKIAYILKKEGQMLVNRVY
jgi:hypothetical protein